MEMWYVDFSNAIPYSVLAQVVISDPVQLSCNI